MEFDERELRATGGGGGDDGGWILGPMIVVVDFLESLTWNVRLCFVRRRWTNVFDQRNWKIHLLLTGLHTARLYSTTIGNSTKFDRHFSPSDFDSELNDDFLGSANKINETLFENRDAERHTTSETAASNPITTTENQRELC